MTVEKNYEPGDCIYRQGERGQGMYVILAGIVELSVQIDQDVRALGQFGPGDFFGDMTLITSQPHAATARALTQVCVEYIDDHSFEAQMREQSGRCFSYLAKLMQRVRIIDSLLRVEWRKQGIPEHTPEVLATRAAYLEAFQAGVSEREDRLDLRIESASGMLSPRIDVVVRRLPFSIGRLQDAQPAGEVSARRLNIPDKTPYVVSRNHCEIIRTDKGLAIRDTGSHLGTILNGIQIGKDFPSMEALLREGSNELVLGGRRSHIRFILNMA